jgi:hypothetical protein
VTWARNIKFRKSEIFAAVFAVKGDVLSHFNTIFCFSQTGINPMNLPWFLVMLYYKKNTPTNK